MLNTILTEVNTVIVDAVVIVLCPFGAMILKLVIGRIKNNFLRQTIADVVKGVEKQFSGEAGERKLELATGLVTDYAAKHGFVLSADSVRTLIEAAVYGLQHQEIDDE